MNRRRLILLIGGLLLVAMSFYCRYVWLDLQPITDERLIQQRDTKYDIAVAFTTALRKNDPRVYDLAHPDLWPKIDEWMNTHEAKHCSRHNTAGIVTGGGTFSFSPAQSCTLPNGEGFYFIRINSVTVSEDKLVTYWGEVEEDIP